MSRILISAFVLLGGLSAAGAVMMLGGKAPATSVDVAIVGCCGDEKAACGDACCGECVDCCRDGGAGCCDGAVACCDAAAACCDGAGGTCCGVCLDKGEKVGEEAACCAEKAACSAEKIKAGTCCTGN
jgi:hypothetical protein